MVKFLQDTVVDPVDTEVTNTHSIEYISFSLNIIKPHHKPSCPDFCCSGSAS